MGDVDFTRWNNSVIFCCMCENFDMQCGDEVREVCHQRLFHISMKQLLTYFRTKVVERPVVTNLIRTKLFLCCLFFVFFFVSHSKKKILWFLLPLLHKVLSFILKGPENKWAGDMVTTFSQRWAVSHIVGLKGAGFILPTTNQDLMTFEWKCDYSSDAVC